MEKSIDIYSAVVSFLGLYLKYACADRVEHLLLILH